MSAFPKLGLIARPEPEHLEGLLQLVHFLSQKSTLYLEDSLASLIPLNLPFLERLQLIDTVDLLLVFGGDGRFLYAARDCAIASKPILGVNRGGLGFLTDIRSEAVESTIGPILEGSFYREERFLLSAEIWRNQQLIGSGLALNDVVLHCGEIARMISFNIMTDNRAICHLRADGVIISTPTGSTAYSLSGGGPIVEPDLNAMLIVPMHPHTLSARPIVCSGDKTIRLQVAEKSLAPKLSLDGHSEFQLQPLDEITIQKYTNPLTLIHPLDYDYYSILRQKLQWNLRLTP